MLTTTPSDIVNFIKQAFPNLTVRIDRSVHGNVRGLATLLRALPDSAVLVASPDRSRLIAASGEIEAMIATWESGTLDARQQSFYATAIASCLRVLEKCPDQAPSKSTPRLAFVGDDELRNDLELDVTAVESALAAGSWKVAVVLSGSVIEALLLNELLRVEASSLPTLAAARQRVRHPDAQQPLDRMKFHSLIDVAKEAQCIDAELETLTDMARDFRNLVHPGVTLRTSKRADRGEAMQTAGAMFSLIKHLDEEARRRTAPSPPTP